MNWIQGNQEILESGSSDDEYAFHKIKNRANDLVRVWMMVKDGKQLTMEVDTGATLSIISEKTRKPLFPDDKLHQLDLVLKTYTNKQLKVVGTLNVQVQYEDQLKSWY